MGAIYVSEKAVELIKSGEFPGWKLSASAPGESITVEGLPRHGNTFEGKGGSILVLSEERIENSLTGYVDIGYIHSPEEATERCNHTYTDECEWKNGRLVFK